MIIEERASTHVYRQKRLFTKEELEALLTIDVNEWLKDVEDPETGIKQYFAQFGDMLPKEMADELAKLEANLKA